MTSADRMLSVLSLFSMDRSEWTAEGAAAELRFSLSTTYRYFSSLARAGLITPLHGNRTGVYVLGPASIEMDWLIRRTDPLTNAGRGPLRFLAGSLDRAAVLLLCRLYYGQVMCITHETVGFPSFGSTYERGRPMPLFRGAASKVILANMPNKTIRALLRDRSGELPGAAAPNAFKASLAEVRRDGASVTQAEVDEGLTGIAAPIFDADGVIGSIAYAFATDSLDTNATARFRDLVKVAAEQVSLALVADLEPAPISRG